MSGTLRLSTFIYKDVLDVVNDGKVDGQCGFGGGSAYAINNYLESIKSHANCTIEIFHSLGDLNHTTGQYDGAIGAVQRREADMLTAIVYYPLVDANQEYFDYAPVNIKDIMMIASAYQYNENTQEKDVLDVISGFKIDFFWGILATFVFLVIFFKIGLKFVRKVRKRIGKARVKVTKIEVNPKDRGQSIRNRKRTKRKRDEKRSPMWLILRSFLLDDNFDTNFDENFQNFYNLFVTATCLFTFFFSSYMLNGMSTDMVVVRDPIVISSYQDVLDRDDVHILWPTFLADSQTFREAPKDSMESKLWERRQLLESDGKSSMFSQGMKLMKEIVNQKLITILREPFIKYVTTLAFTIARKISYDFSKMRALLIIDPNAKSYSRSMLFSKTIDLKLKKILTKRIQSMCEHGLYHEHDSRMALRQSSEEGMMDLIRITSSRILKPPTPKPIIGLSNTIKVFRLISVLFLIDFIVLVIEVLMYRIDNVLNV